MKWFTTLFRRKTKHRHKSIPDCDVFIPMPIIKDDVADNPFKVLANIVCDRSISKDRNLEIILSSLRERFNNRQFLLFKTLCLLYDKNQDDNFNDFLIRLDMKFHDLKFGKNNDIDAIIANGISLNKMVDES